MLDHCPLASSLTANFFTTTGSVLFQCSLQLASDGAFLQDVVVFSLQTLRVWVQRCADAQMARAEKLERFADASGLIGMAEHFTCLLYTSPSPRDRG